jgi:murein DD-endopeptidase MepM/ murein hydrolase activator NlpD
LDIGGSRSDSRGLRSKGESLRLKFRSISAILPLILNSSNLLLAEPLPVTVLPLENGSLSSGFGPRLHPITEVEAHHDGIDIAAAKGTPVYAIGSGWILFAGTLDGYGKTVAIFHGRELVSRYAHLDDLAVRVGEVVQPGSLIGWVGDTGRVTGPHLHFELRNNGSPEDPALYLSKVSSFLNKR